MIISSNSSTTVATFDIPGGIKNRAVVGWFVSEALGLAYLVHARPADGEQRVLMTPLGCGAAACGLSAL